MNKAPPPKPNTPVSVSKAYDALLDPLPTAEVVESDSESAWGQWEGLLDASKQPTFEDTVPMSPLDLPPEAKSPKK